MKRLPVSFAALALALAGVVVPAAAAPCGPDNIAGTWSLVSIRAAEPGVEAFYARAPHEWTRYTVGPAGQPGTSVVLYPPDATPGLSDTERRTVAEMMAKGTYATLLLATPDLDATFERVQTGTVDVVQEPMDQPYGVRDCAVRDPAGNLIRIQEVRP